MCQEPLSSAVTRFSRQSFSATSLKHWFRFLPQSVAFACEELFFTVGFSLMGIDAQSNRPG